MNFEQERYVPITTAISVLFGGPATQVFWFVFFIGCLFSLPFLKQTDLSWISTKTFDASAPATITDIKETSASSNNVRIKEYKFSFQHEGKEFRGSSFAGGSNQNINDSVMVEFPKLSPERARIVGMRANAFGAGTLIVLIFPLFGFIGVAFGLRSHLKTLRLLKRGVLTTGKVLATESTNITINDQPLFKVNLEYRNTSTGQVSTFSVSTVSPEVITESENIQVVYDSRDPNSGQALDLMPDTTRRFFSGDDSPKPKAFLLLILPLLWVALMVLVIRS